jgi:hypothetical protein
VWLDLNARDVSIEEQDVLMDPVLMARCSPQGARLLVSTPTPRAARYPWANRFTVRIEQTRDRLRCFLNDPEPTAQPATSSAAPRGPPATGLRRSLAMATRSSYLSPTTAPTLCRGSKRPNWRTGKVRQSQHGR